jgi:ribosome recycling factor
MHDEILNDARDRMGKSVDSFASDLSRLRTGRAQTGLIDHLSVTYYGASTPLGQVGNVGVEDARTLSVTVWDRSMIESVEKAILESNLGLNPVTAGNVIRIPLPALTEERRKSLIKILKSEAEQARVAVRNIRRDAIAHFKGLAKSKEISEDDVRRGEEQAQKATDEFVGKIDEIVAHKEREMLEV